MRIDTRPTPRQACARAARAAALAAVAAVSLAAAARAQPLRFEAEFAVTWLGLPIYSGTATGSIAKDRYRLRTAGRSRGLLELIGESRIGTEAEGRVEARRLRPLAFASRSRWKRKIRLIRVAYGADGRVRTEIVPREHKGKRDPVPQAMRRAAYDPATAFLAAITVPLSAPPCRLTLPVFDGRRRFDLRMDYVAKARLPRLVAGVPVSDAVRCRLTMRRIAGFSKKHNRRNPGPLPAVDLLVVKVPKAGVWFPVRLSVDSGWGAIVSRLTRLAISNGRPAD